MFKPMSYFETRGLKDIASDLIDHLLSFLKSNHLDSLHDTLASRKRENKYHIHHTDIPAILRGNIDVVYVCNCNVSE